MAPRPPISVYILTGCNSLTLERALKSVAGWADEIVIVDSLLEEKTAEIGRRYATKFVQQKWLGFRGQYKLGSDLCSHEWRMFIDADEELSAELREEIDRRLSGNSGAESAYAFPRKTYFLGKWIRHGNWGNDCEIRLYQKDRGYWGEGLHAAVETDDSVVRMKSVLYHYSFENIAHTLRTINNYSTTDAEIWAEKNGTPPNASEMLIRPFWRAFRSYFLKGGFLDGFPGIYVAAYEAIYAFFKYAKRWEKAHVKSLFPSEDYYGKKTKKD